MYHIVVDFEFTSIPKSQKMQRKIVKNEIVEIGAVKLNDNYEVIDEFSSFVRPRYSFIDPNCSMLTGITNNDILKAPRFTEAIDAFLQWIGNEDFCIYAWSENDKEQFDGECILNSVVERFNILYNKDWIDLQLSYIELVGLSKAISLQRALNSLNIFFEGKIHRATDDAYNTASILQVMKNKDEFQKRFVPLQDVLKPKEPSTCTLGELLGDKIHLLYDLTA